MKSKWTLMTAFAAALSIAQPGMAQAPAAKAEQAKSSTKKKAIEAAPAPTAQEVTDAKAKGMVWVNTSTKVYHKDGAFYGLQARTIAPGKKIKDGRHVGLDIYNLLIEVTMLQRATAG